MSREVYSQYSVSEKQRAKLEQERLKRQEEERRRQEEARKEKIERRRREKIKAEKRRLAIAHHFQAQKFSRQRRELTGSKHFQPVQSRRDEISMEMQTMLRNVEEQLEIVPPDWGRILAPELEEIKQAVLEIKKENCDPYYYPRLLWLQRDLKKLFGEAPHRVEELYKQAEQVRKKIDELVVELEIVKASAVLEKYSHNAYRLISALEVLVREEEPKKLISEFAALDRAVQRLLNKFSLLQERAQMRGFVMQSIREVLTEMNYRAMEVESDTDGESQELFSMFFRTPEQGAVQVIYGLDNSLHAEFVTLKGAADNSWQQAQPADDLLYKCEKWCKDYEFLLAELSGRGIGLQEHWRTPPAGIGYREIAFSQECLEDGDEDVFPPSAADERGKQA